MRHLKSGSLKLVFDNSTLGLAAIVLICAGCTHQHTLDDVAPFSSQIGKPQVLLRKAYLYRFPPDNEVALWDSEYVYFKANSAGEMQRIVEDPLAICREGSLVVIESVARVQRFDNPEVVRAVGTIQCDGAETPFRYIWGLWPHFHEAPWESLVYAPTQTKVVQDD